MSLEENLNQLTDAVRILASAVAVLATNAIKQPVILTPPAQSVPVADGAAPVPPLPGTPLNIPRGRGRPRNPEAPAAPVAAAPVAQAAPAADPFATEAAPAPAVTKQDVRDALVAYQTRLTNASNPKAGEIARDVLVKVGGVDTLATLPEAKFAAVIAAAVAGK